MSNNSTTDRVFIAKTIFGLEEVLASELRKMGAREIEELNRAVKFTGDIGMMYKANLCLRTALRILVPIEQFEANNEQELYDGIKKIDWELYLNVNDSLAIDTVLSTDIFTHSQFISQKAKENVKLARMDDLVQVKESNMVDFVAPEGGGVVIMNPPYGERMDKDDIMELYKMIGDTFKKNFTGYDCWIITSNMEALKHVGLRASRKIKVFNGPLECRFVKYEMYRGTKKLHKIKEPNPEEQG